MIWYCLPHTALPLITASDGARDLKGPLETQDTTQQKALLRTITITTQPKKKRAPKLKYCGLH
jgi:hypothetical protein